MEQINFHCIYCNQDIEQHYDEKEGTALMAIIQHMDNNCQGTKVINNLTTEENTQLILDRLNDYINKEMNK
jgi:uncharacterized Fe-S radical SAM superfamily protein PflX